MLPGRLIVRRKRLFVPPASSRYPILGLTYRFGSHEIEYSDITRTGKDYDNSGAGIPEGYRMSTAGDERAIQRVLEESGHDIRQSEDFDGLFARGHDEKYIWQWTSTRLCVPKGKVPSVYETDSQGRKYWVRTVYANDRKVGEILVPEGRGRLITKWDEVFGIPQVTEEDKWPHPLYTTHFWFSPESSEVAVMRWSDLRHDNCERCFGVVALYSCNIAVQDSGIRMIRGSEGEIEKEITEIKIPSYTLKPIGLN